MSKPELSVPIRNLNQLTSALRRIRKLKNLTQGQLGESAGLPQTTVSKVEVGLIDPTTTTLFKILAALNVELVVRPKKKSLLGDKK